VFHKPRQGLMKHAVERLERLIALANLVKVSEAALRLAYPGVAVEETARPWLATGAPDLVLLARWPGGSPRSPGTGSRRYRARRYPSLTRSRPEASPWARSWRAYTNAARSAFN
jgi:hypothetical protein